MNSFRSFVRIFAVAVVLACGTVACSSSTDTTPATWVGSWGSAQYVADGDNALPLDITGNVTLRQLVRLSVGGPEMRVRVSNAFGTEPLHVLSLHVARSLGTDSSRIDPSSDRIATFGERTEVIIPAGAELTSDPIDFAVEPLSILAVTMELASIPERQTGHPGSRTTSYLSPGLSASAAELESPQRIERWYFLSAIDVRMRGGAAIAVIGDSITDGRGSTTDGNDRWTDVLAERLQASPKHRHLGVLNMGIGGNRLLLDGNGPHALSRFDRDILARSGVEYLIVLEGINDLGMLTRDAPASEREHDELVRQMIQAYREMITRARTHGIKVIGATLMPFGGFDYYHPDETNERDRQRVNEWIRAAGNFDAVVDFDKVTADPAQPDRLLAEYDVGDHIHPSPAGFRAMGEAVPLELFDD